MNSLNYMLESSLALAFLWIIYWLLLRNETQFSVRRYFLLASLIASLLLPLVDLPATSGSQFIPTLEKALPVSWLPEAIVHIDSPVSQGAYPGQVDWIHLGGLVYTGVTLVLFVVLCIQLVQMWKLFSGKEKYRWSNYWVTESDQCKPTFSFFNFIFIGQAHLLSAEEKKEVLVHESIHASKHHSIDRLLIGFVKVIWWFHPSAYFIQQEIVKLHEFEADEQSVEGKNVDQYCALLAKMALREAGYTLGSHFTNSLTIKRINMMKTLKQSLKSWRIATVAMLAVVLILAIACEDQIESKVSDSNLPPEVQEQITSLNSYYSDLVVIIPNEQGKKTLERLKKENPNYKEVSVIHSGETGIDYVILGKSKNLSKNESKIFTKVDNSASPVLGLEKLYERLQTTIQYPTNARNNGVKGKVFIEFVVETDGSLSNINILRGVSDEIDTEALRAFYQVKGTWNPAIHQGQLVKMKMVLPIKFSLDGGSWF